MQNKKRSKLAQAQIITIILIILIVIVGMLIVWNFVRPLINRAADSKIFKCNRIYDN